MYNHADGADRYFYDEYGHLIGYDFHSLGAPSACEAYDDAFDPSTPPFCAFEPNCGVGHGVDGGPARCGDGILDAGESCDRIVGQQTCASATQGAEMHGTLKCTERCEFDVSACTP